MLFIMEQLINSLRKIKESHKINLGLDEEIASIFFTEKLVGEDI